jgi:hypothetical protein
MSSSEPEKTPNVPSSPIARKHRNLNAFPVTPSPTKDCGGKRPFVENEPSSNAWKTSRTTPPSKVTDDPFIDNDRKPPSKSVPIGDKKTHEQTLIPVTTKMINSAVSEDNQFVLKDGRSLHLVKVLVLLYMISTPRRNNKWKRCDIKHRTKKKDQQIRSIILENYVVPPAHAQRVYMFASF